MNSGLDFWGLFVESESTWAEFQVSISLGEGERREELD